MEVPVIDDWVLSTVHIWVIRFDKQEARRLIESKITLERLYEAFVKLHESAQSVSKPVKHNEGGKAGSAIEQTAKEIVDVIYDLDKGTACPKFMVSSRELCQVPVTNGSNSDIVPLGSRLEELEKTVQSLVKGFQDLKTSSTPHAPSFASVAGSALGVTGPFRAGVGHLPGANSHGQAAVGRGVQGQGGARSRVDSLSGRGFPLGQRERLSSESKRSYAEMVSGDQPESEGGQFQYQGRRQPRKVNYGKSNVNIAGGEAAPYEVFIGNKLGLSCAKLS